MGDKCSTTKPTRKDDSQQWQRDCVTVGSYVPTVGSLYLCAKGTLAQSKSDAMELIEHSNEHSGKGSKFRSEPGHRLPFPTVTTLYRGLK
jgi:hypothetical protein